MPPFGRKPRKPAISAALAAGKPQKLLAFDRYATTDVKIPGLEAGSVTRFLPTEPVTPIDAAISPKCRPGRHGGSVEGLQQPQRVHCTGCPARAGRVPL